MIISKLSKLKVVNTTNIDDLNNYLNYCKGQNEDCPNKLNYYLTDLAAITSFKKWVTLKEKKRHWQNKVRKNCTENSKANYTLHCWRCY